jgi:hypothetical protein
MLMIIRASSAMARDHMKKAMKVRPYCPTFMNELSDADTDLHCDSCPTSLKVSFQWWMCHLSQCEQQMCGVLVKGESLFLAGAGTCCTSYDTKIICMDCTFPIMSWIWHLFQQCWRCDLIFGSERGDSDDETHTHLALFVRDILNEH